jgi:hypothetical protein
MGHAKWSPVDKPDIKDQLEKGCMEGVEEARVNLGLQSLGMPFKAPSMYGRNILELMVREVMDNKVAAATVRAVAMQGTDLEGPIGEVLEKFAEQGNDHAKFTLGIVKTFRRRMLSSRLIARSTVPTFKQGLKISHWLEKQIRKQTPTGEDPEQQVKKVMVTLPCKQGRTMKPKKQMPLKRYYRNASMNRTSKGAMNWEPKHESFFGPRWGECRPGEMHIHYPDLRIPLKDPNLEKVTKARAAEEGTEFRYIERFVSDKRVFKRRAKQKKGGGTALLDVSSTMDLSDRDVMNVVEGSPEATKVATYCGLASGTGRLSIVVDKGKRASPEDVAHRYGNGNVIDVHALDWLSCQPEPRVWFTDGGVTGCGHNCDQNYRDVCNTIVSENGIIQCRTIEEVCAALRREGGSVQGVFKYRDDICPDCKKYDCECDNY